MLKNTRAPALLLEIGFIDNSNDNKLFDAQFEPIVEGVVGAILEIAEMKNPRNSCPTCGQKINV